MMLFSLVDKYQSFGSNCYLCSICGHPLNFTPAVSFSNASLWTFLCHVCLGLSLLHFSCGIQSKASFLMASCHPIVIDPIFLHGFSYWTALLLKVKGMWYIRMCGTTHSTMKCHVPEDVYLQQHCHYDLRSYSSNGMRTGAHFCCRYNSSCINWCCFYCRGCVLSNKVRSRSRCVLEGCVWDQH
jgi:hypothetical protein